MFSHPGHGMAKEEVAKHRKEGGRWLRAKREAAGLSQRELADMLGSDYYSFISQLEAGKGRPPVIKMEMWADALRVPHHEFAKNILRWYDPLTFKMLFGQEAAPDMVGPRTKSELAEDRPELASKAAPASSGMAEVVARLNRLEALLMLKGAERLPD